VQLKVTLGNKVESFAKNLRFFFGPEASWVWSLWRDRERAFRSVELYENVRKQLIEDLSVEKGKRGSLVRVRSNEVTEIKDKMQSKSEERLKANKTLEDSEDLVDTFLGRMEVRVRSIFSDSPGISQLNETIEKSRKEVKVLDRDIDKIATELSQAVYKQNAAKDPIDDLEFAIEHLTDEIASCRSRADEAAVKINQLIVQECAEGGPLQLESMLVNGLKPRSGETFCELYLEIHDHASDLIAQPSAPQPVNECEFTKELSSGFTKNEIQSRVNVNMSGVGSHHRKVSRGKKRVWREFQVKFSGRVNTSFVFHQRHWNSKAGAEALKNKALEKFHSGRNQKLKELEKEFDVTKHSLLHSAERLFEQL
jgi:hypothetical protein